MKKVSVIVLVVVGLLFAAYAEAAKPKRRTRNANRIGPYAGAMIGMNNYTGDQTAVEDDLESSFTGVPTQDLDIGTDDQDIGYAAQFGYRFNRYLAAEFALAQLGDLRSSAHANVELPSTAGFVPASIDVNYHVGGPILSAIGILPLNDKFELFGRAGVLFASAEREFVIKVDGNVTSFGSSKGESTELVLGAGAAWHVNQMFSVRAQFERMDEVGDPDRTGTEDITTASIGLVVRF
jgi:opacity protein-like surface antigen